MGSSPIFRAINFENRPIGRAKDKKRLDMVAVVQLVRTPDCGSGGRQFESVLRHHDAGKWGMSDAPTDHSLKTGVLAHSGSRITPACLENTQLG